MKCIAMVSTPIPNHETNSKYNNKIFNTITNINKKRRSETPRYQYHCRLAVMKGSNGWSYQHMFIVVVVLAAVLSEPGNRGGGSHFAAATPATGNFATNEVYGPEETEVDVVDALPLCTRGAICGVVEVNAYGVNAIPLCNCRRDRTNCQLAWDEHDGKSVTVGSKQYKYCHPPGGLPVCGRDEKAYVTSYFFQPSTFHIIRSSHRLLCFCPPSARHLSPAISEEDFQDGLLIVSSIHTCDQLKQCEVGQACKEVTIAEVGSQVAVKCRCPYPEVCPTLSQTVAPYSNKYNKGTGYSVFCQNMY